jgi:long-chain acyl-CoA synthetase
LYPIIANVKNKTMLTSIITTSTETFASDIGQKPNVHSFQQLLTEKFVASKTKINPSEDLAALQYTGGTTGIAKGAMLTHSNLVANTIAFATWIKGATAKEVFLAALPLFHIYGMTTSMNVPISLATTMVLLPKFDTTTSLTAIQQYKVTVFCGVPTMYAALLANPNIGNFDLTSIRVCISGASSLPPQVQRRFIEVTGGLLAEGYGLTEASPVTHCNPVDKTMLSVRVGSIGLPLPNTDACIFDSETGTKKLKPNEIGELAIRGPQVMKGYWKNPEETGLVLHDSWLFTGDIGRMDKDGYFYITDRKKDLIKYKGYSIYPRELEDVLYEHPAVRLCAIVGKPDAEAGEIPKAYVMLKEDGKVTERALIEFVNERVAPYKRVQELELRNELPISSAGKVLKRVLLEEMKSAPTSKRIS